MLKGYIMTRKDDYKSLLDACLEEECDCKHWCLLKEMTLASFKYDPRTLIQFKCVEIYKYEESKKHDKELSWEDAWNKWTNTKLAEKFAEVYDKHPTMKPQLMYKKIIQL